MITRQQLEELRIKSISQYLSLEEMRGLFSAIDKLLKVKEAASAVAWYVETIDSEIDPAEPEQQEYILQKEQFFKALAEADKPEGTGKKEGR